METIATFWPLAHEVYDGLGRIYGPVMAQAATQQAGLPPGFYFGWMLAAPGFEPAPISAELLAVRGPYTSVSLNAERLAEAARLGMLRPVGSGEYFLTEAGRAAAKRIFQAAYDAMAVLQPLPSADLERLAGLLHRVVAAVQDAAEPPGKWSFRLSRAIDPGPDAVPLIWIDQYLTDLNAYRDDSHLAAWRPYNLNGAGWEVFTRAWRGEATTLDELYGLLAFRGHPRETYAGALHSLVARGWLVREDDLYALTELGRQVRQEVEATTDRYFYEPWRRLDATDLAELWHLLTALRDSLASRHRPM